MTARKKTSDGNGSIRKELDADGRIVRWRFKVMVGRKPDGSRDVRRGSAKTEREARKGLNSLATAKDTGRLPSASAARGSVADLVNNYLAMSKAELSPKTYRKEEQFASLHIVPAIGAIRQRDLKPAHVRDLLGTLALKGLAPETVKGIKGTLARSLDLAVDEDVLPRNVARLGRRQRTHRAATGPVSQHAFTYLEVGRIRDASKADRFGAFWTTLLLTGMHFGEAAALSWRDFDPEARTLTISRSLERVANAEPYFSDPKSYASRRTIRVPATLVVLLKAHKATQNQERLKSGNAYRTHDLIFASTHGSPLMHRNLFRSFTSLLERVGLDGSPHTCRHTEATSMLYAGVPLNEVSHLLGHAGVEVTAKVYAHSMPRGSTRGWQRPPGLDGLELLAAWYGRADEPEGLALVSEG